MSAELIVAIVVVVFVAAMGLQQISRSRLERTLTMSSLTRGQRREIWKAVNRGTAVRHQELAAPTVELAQRLQRPPRRPVLSLPNRNWKIIVSLAMGAVGLVNLVWGDWLNAVFYGLCVPCLVFAEELYWNPLRHKRDAAIAANGG